MTACSTILSTALLQQLEMSSQDKRRLVLSWGKAVVHGMVFAQGL